jgi:hypothetical protein
MKRSECWMKFSDALDQYMDAREAIAHMVPCRAKDEAYERLKEAKDHMDALTGDGDPE